MFTFRNRSLSKWEKSCSEFSKRSLHLWYFCSKTFYLYIKNKFGLAENILHWTLNGKLRRVANYCTCPCFKNKLGRKCIVQGTHVATLRKSRNASFKKNWCARIYQSSNSMTIVEESHFTLMEPDPLLALHVRPFSAPVSGNQVSVT